MSAGAKWGLWGGIVGGSAAMAALIPKLRRRAMKVTNILMKDHRVVGGMIMTLEMAPRFNGMVRRSLFNQIRQQLLVHSQVEEELFYPAVRNLNFGYVDQYVNESYREHQNIKDLLSQLSNIDPVREEFIGKFADLRRTVQHHVEEEEGRIFPMVERHMSVEQLEQLGQRIHDRKSDLKKRIAA
jgi:hemerythrin superfamily protein